ncbi:hypothetical protein F4777DRAFT_126184 [Nemania sp. FL0916]|nr:hypothetical protein F4777DRAFT_126184 [Nemania sp. FL0916]
MASQTDTQEVNTQDVAKFFELLRALSESPSTTWIDQVLKTNESMKASVQEKDNDHDGLIRSITRLRTDLDTEIEKSKNAIVQSDEAKLKASQLTAELEDAQKTIATKDQQLEEDNSIITGLKGNIDSLSKELEDRNDIIKKQEEQQATDGARIKELEGQLEATQTDLNMSSNTLKEIQSLSCRVVDRPKDFVLTEIDRIYGYAKAIAVTYFGEDLPAETFADTALFEGIRKLVKPIPFPASNSGPAKKARIAALLSLLGSRLAEQIFLPFYMSPPGDDQDLQNGVDTIAFLLSDLSLTDPQRELHLRSVLLASSPEEQMRIAYERSDDIANEVFHTLGLLLSFEQQEQFHMDISKLCRLAVEGWNSLRPLKEKVEPFMETDEDTEKYWLPAELDNNNKKQQPNGKQNGLGSKPSMHSLKSASKVVMIWPGFSYGADVLKQGFMLLDSQVRLADEEAQPLKRDKRAMARAAISSSSQRRGVVKKPKMYARPAD